MAGKNPYCFNLGLYWFRFAPVMDKDVIICDKYEFLVGILYKSTEKWHEAW